MFSDRIKDLANVGFAFIAIPACSSWFFGYGLIGWAIVQSIAAVAFAMYVYESGKKVTSRAPSASDQEYPF